jgi:hypothetical protein
MTPARIISDLTNANNSRTVEDVKIAAASSLITKQARLIRELHSAHLDGVKTAAALVQAVKLAQDGAIDISDVLDTARQLIKTGSVRLASADDLFDVSPGDLTAGSLQNASQAAGGNKLDPLTSFLRTV